MKKIKQILIVLVIVSVIIGLGGYNWIRKGAFEGFRNSSNIEQRFEIKEGEGVKFIAKNLVKQQLIENEKFFLYYIWKTKQGNKLQAGSYKLAPNMTIPAMVEKFTKGDIIVNVLKLTVPEGFTNKKIIKLVEEKKPEIAEDFKNIVQCKCFAEEDCKYKSLGDRYEFLTKIPRGVDMEGYLFPDTYFIDDEETGATLVSKFLNNFEKKVDSKLLVKIESTEETLHEVITLASIVEREVPTEKDAKTVAGIFRNRLDSGIALQSCATLAYFQGVDKKQFSYEDTRIESPYNTYLNPGLTPGPISNPGLISIKATIEPKESDYLYFLSNFETGETVYSKTLEEHNANKVKHGL